MKRLNDEIRPSKCLECEIETLPDRRVLYGNQVWYRYTCKNCGESWELATITIGQTTEQKLEEFK